MEDEVYQDRHGCGRRNGSGNGVPMNRANLFSVFMRSLTIQVSFNCRKMQNLGFAFAMLPLIAEKRMERMQAGVFTARHLRMFNTHPYLAASVVGSVARIEEESSPPESAEDLKKALMGPYAAIGDSFFWGALRPFSAVGAVILSLAGSLVAPIAFLLLFTPTHLWVRLKGFVEGYRCGRNGIKFIGALDLPDASIKLRYISLFLTGFLAILATEAAGRFWSFFPEMPGAAMGAVLLLLIIAGVRLTIPPVVILYGMSILCVAISMTIW